MKCLTTLLFAGVLLAAPGGCSWTRLEKPDFSCDVELSCRETEDLGPCAGQEAYSLDVPLGSGVDDRHVVYRRERLGGAWLLQIRRQSGLTLSSRDGESASRLSEGEFGELVSGLLEIVHRDHHDQLDSIQVDLTVVDSLWAGAVEDLREADIPLDDIVDPKSTAVMTAGQSYLAESALVRQVCEQVGVIGKKCKKHAVSMNPVVFRSPHLWKRWVDVRHPRCWARKGTYLVFHRSRGGLPVLTPAIPAWR